MLTHPRTFIIEYLINLLKLKVDVGGRVYNTELTDINLENLPCVFVYWRNDEGEMHVGDSHRQKVNKRTLPVSIVVCVEEAHNEGGINHLNPTLKNIDDFCAQIETALDDDENFEKLLEGYIVGSNTNSNLLFASGYTGTELFKGSWDGGTAILGSEIKYDLVYLKDTFEDKKLNDFESYLINFVKPGFDETTIDPIIIQAEGDF